LLIFHLRAVAVVVAAQIAKRRLRLDHGRLIEQEPGALCAKYQEQA